MILTYQVAQLLNRQLEKRKMHKQPTFSAVQPIRLEKFAYSISLSASIATCNILCTLLSFWFRLQKRKAHFLKQ